VCVSVCLVITFVSPAKTAEPINMASGGQTCGPKEPRIRWGRDPPWEWAILMIVWPIEKHWELCYGTLHRQKINNSGTAVAACNDPDWSSLLHYIGSREKSSPL